jgi:hypothetical protein
VPALALLFVAAGHADPMSTLYLDGVAQGHLRELESGLLVEPGQHRLLVTGPVGDTLLSQIIQLAAHDTLDLSVR